KAACGASEPDRNCLPGERTVPPVGSDRAGMALPEAPAARTTLPAKAPEAVLPEASTPTVTASAPAMPPSAAPPPRDSRKVERAKVRRAIDDEPVDVLRRQRLDGHSGSGNHAENSRGYSYSYRPAARAGGGYAGLW